MQKALFKPDRCAKVRFASSGCSKCISICPVHALHFKGQSIEIASDCIGCQLCAAVCPNEIFSFPEKSNAHAGRLLQGNPIVCSKLLAEEKHAPEPLPPGIVPCLGAIPLEFLLSWFSK
ncbi:MAG: 4Fe-4S binding protein, partial [Deltaproteobacteria bacterium]|nr:4Fe-4S binding protein [Deltaproteobacteria bacterium]